MTTAYNGRILTPMSRRSEIGIVWDGQPTNSTINHPKRLPARGCQEVPALRVAARANGRSNENLSLRTDAQSADKLVAADVLPHLPTAQANQARALAASPEFWAEHFDTINLRFQAWLSQ